MVWSSGEQIESKKRIVVVVVILPSRRAGLRAEDIVVETLRLLIDRIVPLKYRYDIGSLLQTIMCWMHVR